jgi:hypothetical protein
MAPNLFQRVEIMIPNADVTSLSHPMHTAIAKCARFFALHNWGVRDFIQPQFITKYILVGDFCAVSLTAPDRGNAMTVFNGELVLVVDEETYHALGLLGKKDVSTHKYRIEVDLADPGFRPGNAVWERWNWCVQERLAGVDFLASWFCNGVANDIIPTNTSLQVSAVCAQQHTDALPVRTEAVRNNSFGAHIHHFESMHLPEAIKRLLKSSGAELKSEIALVGEDLLDWCGCIAGRFHDLLEVDVLAGGLDHNSSHFRLDLDFERAITECDVISLRGLIPSSMLPYILAGANDILKDRKVPFICVMTWPYRHACFPGNECTVRFVDANAKVVMLSSS